MRETRKAIAQETLEILESGHYYVGNKTISMTQFVRRMIDGTKLYISEELEQLVTKKRSEPTNEQPGKIRVVNETTLEAAARLALSEEYKKIGVLNFASAKNPGGGFLGGAQAQEESLARSSALYKSLIHCQSEFYDFHQRQNTPFYSDRMIFTPDCLVYRNDAGKLLEKPYIVDFVTSPAPNLGAMRDERSRKNVSEILGRRSEKVLALFAEKQCDAVVLGAWGCGVFRNEPKNVAAVFAEHLCNGKPWAKHFRQVDFAVLDHTPTQENIKAFQQAFGEQS